MENGNSAIGAAGGSHTQGGASGGMGNKDPFDSWGVNKKALQPGMSEGGGVLASIFMHVQIQSYEEQLQFLNASKADFAQTSVGESDTFFRFLGIRAVSVVMTSLLSMVTGMILFIWIAMKTELFLGYILLFIFLTHSFFPGYISYRMKKFTLKEFTTKYYKKVLTAWHSFELFYILLLLGVGFLRTLRWDIIELFVRNIEFSSTIGKKFFLPLLEKVDLDKMPYALEHLFLALLSMLVLYAFSMFSVHKSAEKGMEKSFLAHDKEKLRPAQIVRIKAGKLARTN